VRALVYAVLVRIGGFDQLLDAPLKLSHDALQLSLDCPLLSI
jgi:hypothetical protein